jgi:soluble lytic murein transglycosylase-like protein
MKKRIGKYVLVLWGIALLFLPSLPQEDVLTRHLPTIFQQQETRSTGVNNLATTQLLPIIWRAAKDYSLPVSLVAAIVKAESGFNPYAVSRTGAIGLMQLMPDTARSLGIRQPYDPISNIYGGVRYFRKLLDRYNGNVHLALAAYNAGPGAVEKYGLRIPPYSETQHYVPKVLTYYKQFNTAWTVD